MDRNFARLLDTLAVLPRGGMLSTTQILERLTARGHEVAPRTLQRDLEDLAGVYPLECDRRSKPYGWRWREGAAHVSLPHMDWPEAVSFHLLDQYLAGVLPASVQESIAPYVEEARRRLAQEFPNLPLRNWPRRVKVLTALHPVVPPKTKWSVHLAWTEAVLLGRKLRIRYQAFGRTNPGDYLVAPLGLVQNGAVFYSPARFEGHQDVRTIALHRVLRAEVETEPSGIEDFDLAAWLATGVMGFGGDEKIRLELRLTKEGAALLAEACLSEDQTITHGRDGQYRLTATVLDTCQLRRWILWMGSRATVLRPTALRRYVADEIRAMAAAY